MTDELEGIPTAINIRGDATDILNATITYFYENDGIKNLAGWFLFLEEKEVLETVADNVN